MTELKVKCCLISVDCKCGSKEYRDNYICSTFVLFRYAITHILSGCRWLQPQRAREYSAKIQVGCVVVVVVADILLQARPLVVQRILVDTKCRHSSSTAAAADVVIGW